MKNDLIRLKAGVLAFAMCFSLSGCASSEEEVKSETSGEVLEQVHDTKSYLVVFIDDTAVIYEDTKFVSSSSGGYASIYEDGASMNFIQTPCVVITGKENSIKFATGIVGSDNVVFVDFPDGKNMELSIKPNN